eukprot:CAMPEP_0181180168 /NCGR_PEP_ID=MMETSP1096-20121128/6651_1 /TAXON_ID=156174 ORGANISM="Chrysochromulina ericina, Strain CCMP281" /NCGR_SAMPLE_ID=MMETSP1096 /ASSEMBLY_ACC=CAM_ASM_000453 /LENGTH=38 /DNA_ID= /DNA_START= /DNA_END= /DNA_ORIENTATION=
MMHAGEHASAYAARSAVAPPKALGVDDRPQAIDECKAG